MFWTQQWINISFLLVHHGLPIQWNTTRIRGNNRKVAPQQHHQLHYQICWKSALFVFSAYQRPTFSCVLKMGKKQPSLNAHHSFSFPKHNWLQTRNKKFPSITSKYSTLSNVISDTLSKSRSPQFSQARGHNSESTPIQLIPQIKLAKILNTS